MNKDIDDLKSLWQEQELDTPNSSDMINQLNELEVKNKRERTLVACFLPITIVPLLFAIPILESPYYIASMIILSVAMIMIIYLIFKNKFEKINSEEEFDNKAFLNRQSQKLKGNMRITSFYMWIYSFLIILGINVCYLEAFSSMETYLRIIIHFVVSIILYVFMFWSIRRRKLKNKNEMEPLIQQLESMGES